MERPKIDVKSQWQSTEIGFDFESVDPAEVDQVLKALVERRTKTAPLTLDNFLVSDGEPG